MDTYNNYLTIRELHATLLFKTLVESIFEYYNSEKYVCPFLKDGLLETHKWKINLYDIDIANEIKH